MSSVGRSCDNLNGVLVYIPLAIAQPADTKLMRPLLMSHGIP